MLGGNFLSRINMDLRETKGWSYGVRGSAQLTLDAVPYIVSAPVQADRTGEFDRGAQRSRSPCSSGNKGVTAEELSRAAVEQSVQALPGGSKPRARCSAR